MIELLKRISENEIVIDINEGELELSSHKTDIDQELLSEIRNNKEELTSYLIKHKSLAFNKIEYQKIPKCKDDISYPLSNAQLRLWLTNRIGDGAIAFNIPKSIILNGEYDVSCFQKAIHAVIERHEILRTVFKVNSKDEVRQYILSSQELGFYIDYKDYRGENNPESVVETYISSDSYKPFDLEKGPLLRASLLQLADDQYVFYYNMHHIISDEWSKDVLSRDVMRYYESYTSGNKPDITQLSIQYKDYAAWQLDQLSSPVYQDHKRYWLERLSGELPVIEIPSNRPRPKVKTGNGRSLNTFLSEGLTNQLNEFIKVEDGSLFTLALAAINVLIYKYTSNRDIIIGSPVTERDHPDLEDQIGFYVNVLTSRNNIDLTDSFIDFHKRVKEGALNDFTHKQYPFDKLVEDLELKYDQGRSPVYDISLTIHNYQDISLKDTNGKIQDKGEVACKFDIEFHIAPFENNTSLEIFYNTDVYDKVMISKMMEHFKQLLSSLLSAPNELLSNIEYLIPDERRKLLHEFNSNQVNHPINKTIVDLFVEQAQKAPDSIALKFEEENLTYKKLDERSNQLARYLQKEGVTQETLVPICIERSIEMIVGILGIIKAGGAYVPIDPEYPEKRINYILTEIDSKIVLTSKKSRSVLDEFRYLKIISFAFEDLNIVSLDQDWELINKESTSSYTPKVSPSDLAYIIYTSGSTGDPKGVMVEHRS
uniref:non-ribosomal peptide synthetase n=1 Tax=Aquimarina algiphila TaxID=2047982 RepID=UPI00249198D9